MAQSHIKLSGVAGNGKSLRATVTQSSHDFGAGDVIRYNRSAGTGSGNQVSGATNNGTSNSSVVWKPASTGTYYYQCSLHSGMVGTIVVQ